MEEMRLADCAVRRERVSSTIVNCIWGMCVKGGFEVDLENDCREDRRISMGSLCVRGVGEQTYLCSTIASLLLCVDVVYDV